MMDLSFMNQLFQIMMLVMIIVVVITLLRESLEQIRRTPKSVILTAKERLHKR